MRHYVMVDGLLQMTSPEITRMLKRAQKQVPQGVPEETKEPEVPRDTRTEYQIIEGLEDL